MDKGHKTLKKFNYGRTGKKLAAAFVLSVMAFTMLAGCGSSTENSSASYPGQTAAATAASEAAPMMGGGSVQYDSAVNVNGVTTFTSD
ncbi:MAG: hypothetical protein HGA22_04370, partial [Clostridiales bacterium]|nr:hypothetical protein [Clostridiales bacterium]